MKHLSKKFAYAFIFTFIAVATSLVSTKSASADTYTYLCNSANGGGNIISTVNITPTGPFNAGTSTNFTASGQITSSCGTRTITLTTQNNSGTVVTLISPTSVGPGTYPFAPASTIFSSPTPAGTYAVHFITGVDEPVPIVQNYYYDTNLYAITDICHAGPDPYYPYPPDPGYVTGSRSPETEQSATSRGVTHVGVDYEFTTDNVKGFVTTYFHADFYPGQLSVSIPGYEYGVDHSSGNYCSQVLTGGEYMHVYVHEDF